MAKVIILGAGASIAAKNIDPNMPMPNLAKLPNVLTNANLPAGFQLAGEYLNRLLAVAEHNLEKLLTCLYRLNEAFFLPRRQYSLDARWIDEIFASSALPYVFTDAQDAKDATSVLEALRDIAREAPGIVAASFSPTNFFTIFQGALLQYFQCAFQRYPCPLHLRAFETLSGNDSVVSFNYDEIADYSLYSAGKLARLSFEGLGFEEIVLPSYPVESCGPPEIPGRRSAKIMESIEHVKYLKVHGSINWFSQPEAAGDDDWTYQVGPPPRVVHVRANERRHAFVAL